MAFGIAFIPSAIDTRLDDDGDMGILADRAAFWPTNPRYAW